MPRAPNANLLLVEGKDELRVIPELVEKRGVPWEPERKSFRVDIVDTDGIENMLDRPTLAAYSKRQGLRRLGMIVDADADAATCWNRVRRVLVEAGILDDGVLPGTAPDHGLIVASRSIRVGVWIMPDNRSTGMLETFLAHLVGPPNELWDFAVKSCAEAVRRGAPFDPARHRDKACIHCWLAWQREPGRQMHQAILYGILDANSPYADPFMAWFCDLFELTAPITP